MRARRQVEVLVPLDLVDEAPRDPVRALALESDRHEEKRPRRAVAGRRGPQTSVEKPHRRPLDRAEEPVGAVRIAGHEPSARQEAVALLFLPERRLLPAAIELR